MSKYWANYWNQIDASKKQVSVGRTKFGLPVEEVLFARELADIKKHLRLEKEDVVLDLCAGNGLITEDIHNYVKKVIAIDYSKPLLDEFVVSSDNVELQHQDLSKYNFKAVNYNKVVWYFAIQHFSLEHSAQIIRNCLDNLGQGGILFIGDIPDIDKKWEFYSKIDYKKFYFDTLIENRDHIGNWFQKDFFRFLLNYLGYEGQYTILEKPDYHFNNGVRFDLLVEK
ncbi:MAG: hypothetical protein CMP59_00505 [Flavobacteriales bacterium]|nr:hypothetical protein [Flavobacteriales bacterium]|tara:strand:- start:1680 stop:2357 length:678 start_codon:yes stop_codon:yes gene_type:complete